MLHLNTALKHIAYIEIVIYLEVINDMSIIVNILN